MPLLELNNKMKIFTTLLVLFLAAVGAALAESYSTETTITPMMTKGEYEVVVFDCQLVEHKGKVKEELESRPTSDAIPFSP